MLRSPLRPALSPALRSPLEPGVGGSIWSASYSFALGVLPAAIAALTRGGAATRIGPAGNVEYGDCNLLIGAGTQNVTVTAAAHTLTLRGTGSITLSGTATGTLTGTGVNDRVSLTFTPTAGTLTLTVSGSITLPRLQLGKVSRAENDALLVTTSAARFLPRIEHSPVSPFSAVGLLVEGQATNLYQRSAEFNNAIWSPSNVTFASGQPGVDGSLSAWLLRPTATGVARLQQGGLGGYNGVHTVSLYAKASGLSWVYIFKPDGSAIAAWFNVLTGIVGTVTAGYVAKVEQGPNGFWRCILTTPAMAQSFVGHIGISSADNSDNAVASGVNGVLFDDAQLEAGLVATSYIPTTGTMVRVGDFSGGGLTGAALTDLITPTSPFTIRFAYRKAYSQASNETLFGLCAGATAGGTNQLQLVTNGTQAQLIHSGGSGPLTGTLTHNGSTTNVIAVSVDPGVLGAERVTNGSFDSGSANWSVSGTDATHTATFSAGTLRYVSDTISPQLVVQQLGILTIGKTYQVTVVISARVSGTLGSDSFSPNISLNSVGTFTFFVQAVSTAFVLTRFTSNVDITVDSVSVREAGAMSISVNGGASVETTGIAYTGAGVTAMVLGARNSAGTDPAVRFTVDPIQSNRTYTTGAALQALSV